MRFMSTVALLCTVSLCFHQATGWKRVVDGDRWWESVFRDLESRDIGSDYFLPGPPMLPGHGHEPPMLIKVIFMNRCKCKTGCEDTPTPGDEHSGSTEAPDPASTSHRQQDDGNAGGVTTPSTSGDDSETIVPPRYRPRNDNTEPAMSTSGFADVPGQQDAQKSVAAVVAGGMEDGNGDTTSTNIPGREKRKLTVYFDGIPSGFARKFSN